MFKKVIKNKEGTALVFVMILITNAIIIVSSIVFISVIQEKASGNAKFSPAAYQKADSGFEYALKIINDSGSLSSDEIKAELCSSFNNGKCALIDLSEIDLYFFDSSGNILTGNHDHLEDIYEIKSVGVDNGVSRSLKATLFDNP